jgi:c-di-GMP-binding flagellar brake protein YcgR
MAGEERRVAERVSVDMPVEVYDYDGKNFLDKGRLLDLSSGGIKMQTGKSFELNDKIMVKFILEKKESKTTIGMAVKGEVEIVYQVAKGAHVFVGLRFLKISGIDQDRIKDFVNYKLSENN